MLMHADTDAARLRELGYEPELARSLSVRDLVIHGLIYMVPLAPIGIFVILYNNLVHRGCAPRRRRGGTRSA